MLPIRPFVGQGELAFALSLGCSPDFIMLPLLLFRGRIATKTYEADAIFDEAIDSAGVYSGMNLSTELPRLLSHDGSELSIVAYGQTGTGKTFTTTYIEGAQANSFRNHSCSLARVHLH